MGALILTWGILEKYSATLTAEARSSPGTSPAFHRESPSFNMTTAEATPSSNVELQEGRVNSPPEGESPSRIRDGPPRMDLYSRGYERVRPGGEKPTSEDVGSSLRN